MPHSTPTVSLPKAGNGHQQSDQLCEDSEREIERIHDLMKLATKRHHTQQKERGVAKKELEQEQAAEEEEEGRELALMEGQMRQALKRLASLGTRVAETGSSTVCRNESGDMKTH